MTIDSRIEPTLTEYQHLDETGKIIVTITVYTIGHNKKMLEISDDNINVQITASEIAKLIFFKVS